MIDMRSDTITRPVPGMREAIARAEVGDDVFGDDPTVNRLQERVAALLGKEAALFVPSGTMANLVAVRTHAFHGAEVLLEEGAHIFNYEGGSVAAVVGVQLRTISTPFGWFTVKDVESMVRPDDAHAPVTALVCMENTHNRAGGTLFPIEEMERIGDFTRERGIGTHLDGARLWNASVASGLPVDRFAAAVDSVSVCFSKGLGAPVGSLLAGTKDFIRRAHRTRKMLGGGMRQAGVLCAACLYALDHHVERLVVDHQNARILACALDAIPGVHVDLERTKTNIVIANVSDHPLSETKIAQLLVEAGVSILAIGPGTLRLVTHLDVGRSQIDEAVLLIQKVLS